MTDAYTEQYAITCAEVTCFWDKQVTKSKTPAQEQAISSHLAKCEDCRDFVKFTSSLKALPVDLRDHEMNLDVQKLINQVHEHRRHRGLIYSRWFGFAAAIVLVVSIGVLLSILLSKKNNVLPAYQCSPSNPNELVPGVFLSYCNDDEPGVLIENGGDVKISLRDGTIGLFIDPKRREKHKVNVISPHGKLFVKGTIFTVQVVPKNTWVEVFRGVVEIKPTGNSQSIFLSSDNGAELTTGKSFLITASRTEALRRKLLQLANKEESKQKEETVENSESAAALPSPKDEASAETTPVTDSDNEAEPIQSHNASISEHPNSNTDATIDMLTQKAQSCLINRDWECAITHYRKALARYPQHPESLAVLISLAKLELRILHEPATALAHYKTYIRRAANGPLSEEAYFGITEAYRSLGNMNKELESLHHFVTQFPDSSLIQKAKTRMNQLQKELQPST